MNIIVRLFGAIVLQISAFAAMSSMAMSDDKPLRVYTQETPAVSEGKTTQRICSLDPIEDLLPPPQTKASNTLLSYLAEQGFTQNQEGSWVCYANDPKKEGRYFTLFKVKQVDGRLIASSFLDEGNLIQGQENRSLDFFMMLIKRHMNTSQENRQGIRRYLEAFVSLVKEGKIKPTRRGFLFDQPNRALVLYHTLSSGNLKGTGITINIYLPKS
ncbi:hypothetical protein ACEYW6_04800 [Nostoc sp. UIC 10607]|uniref:Uncharacterized protein n=2 Tax=Nostoc TaxID=1177 RepID=A0ABR8I4B5_9NOSO|nr:MULTISPECIES: hypothetical protein [Nostoc]MBD2561309.1 hypothetical protein [Nostoc linckia FACHB-391]MBD2646449.1 hypothetical protein [Nostoc foliaceum FACHB-393]